MSLDWIQIYTDNNVFPLPLKNQLLADFLLKLLKGFYQSENLYLLRRRGLPNARESKAILSAKMPPDWRKVLKIK